jgi:hypothetical protein
MQSNNGRSADPQAHVRAKGAPPRRRGWIASLAGGACSIAALAILGGFTAGGRGCCEDRFCSNLKNLGGPISRGYEKCCGYPPDQQQKCFEDLEKKTQETETLIFTAKIACDEGDDELLDDTIKKIRDIWFKKDTKRSGDETPVNPIGILGPSDWLRFDAALPRRAQPCEPVPVAIVDGRIVHADAAGALAESSPDARAGADVTATIVPAQSAQPIESCSYEFPRGTRITGNIEGRTWSDWSFGGTIAIAPLADAADDADADGAPGAADIGADAGLDTDGANDADAPNAGDEPHGRRLRIIGLPTAASWRFKGYGQVITMDLETSSPHNAVKVNSGGDGKLCVMMKVDSPSRDMKGFIAIGATLYFEFPIEVAPDWSSIRLHSSEAMPGHLLAPIDAPTLAAQYGTSSGRIARDRCGDQDGNGIRDGADSEIHALLCGSGCKVCR